MLIGAAVAKMIPVTTRSAARVLVKPTARTRVPPIASSARNESEPSAVCAIRKDDQRRAFFAVKRRA